MDAKLCICCLICVYFCIYVHNINYNVDFMRSTKSILKMIEGSSVCRSFLLTLKKLQAVSSALLLAYGLHCNQQTGIYIMQCHERSELDTAFCDMFAWKEHIEGIRDWVASKLEKKICTSLMSHCKEANWTGPLHSDADVVAGTVAFPHVLHRNNHGSCKLNRSNACCFIQKASENILCCS